jgi:hypothetical protein
MELNVLCRSSDPHTFALYSRHRLPIKRSEAESQLRYLQDHLRSSKDAISTQLSLNGVYYHNMQHGEYSHGHVAVAAVHIARKISFVYPPPDRAISIIQLTKANILQKTD